MEFVPKPELERAQQQIEKQKLEIERLQQENDRLRKELEAALRAGKRQAAPHSRGRPKAHPKRPGRKPGRDYGKQARRAWMSGSAFRCRGSARIAEAA